MPHALASIPLYVHYVYQLCVRVELCTLLHAVVEQGPLQPNDLPCRVQAHAPAGARAHMAERDTVLALICAGEGRVGGTCSVLRERHTFVRVHQADESAANDGLVRIQRTSGHGAVQCFVTVNVVGQRWVPTLQIVTARALRRLHRAVRRLGSRRVQARGSRYRLIKANWCPRGRRHTHVSKTDNKGALAETTTDHE